MEGWVLKAKSSYIVESTFFDDNHKASISSFSALIIVYKDNENNEIVSISFFI